MAMKRKVLVEGKNRGNIPNRGILIDHLTLVTKLYSNPLSNTLCSSPYFYLPYNVKIFLAPVHHNAGNPYGL